MALKIGKLYTINKEAKNRVVFVNLNEYLNPTWKHKTFTSDEHLLYVGILETGSFKLLYNNEIWFTFPRPDRFIEIDQ